MFAFSFRKVVRSPPSFSIPSDVSAGVFAGHHWPGGSLFNMRGQGQGTGGYTLTFRDIRVEDPRPSLQHFKVMMEGVEPWASPDDRKRGPGDLYGITFNNINIAAPSVLGEQEVLWGMEDDLIYGLVFDNVTIGGQPVESVDYFYHNEFVFDDRIVNC